MKYFEDPLSPQYADIAERYGTYWSEHELNDEHYRKVRTAILSWYRKLIEQNVRPSEGGLVVCAPGFDTADDRELNAEVVESFVSEHPVVVVTDFVPEAIVSGGESIARASGDKGLARRILGTRRDVSRGLSARFDAIIRPMVDRVRTPKELIELTQRLHQTIGVEEVRKRRLPRGGQLDGYNPKFICGFDGEEAMSFRSVTQEVAPIRFVLANLLLAGMFAPTEQHFRRKFMALTRRGSQRLQRKMKEEHRPLDDEQVSEVLRVWHGLIEEMNSEAAKQFLLDVLESNPHAHIFAATDVNTNYGDPLGQYTRLNTEKLSKDLQELGKRVVAVKQYTFSDEEEEPPHSHKVDILEVRNNGNHGGKSAP